jgi:hypothetical protein
VAANKLTIEITGVEKALKLFHNLSLNKPQTGRVLNQLGREMVVAGTKLSPKDKLRTVDPRRRPVDKSFAWSWRFEVKREINNKTLEAIELRVGNVDPKAQWIIEGTGPRKIPTSVSAQLAKGYPMNFFWERGPQGAGYYQSWQILGGVAARGTPPHPVVEEVVRDVNIPQSIHDIAAIVVNPLGG